MTISDLSSTRSAAEPHRADEQPLFDLIVRRAVSTVGATAGTLYLVEPGSGRPTVWAALGPVGERPESAMPPGYGIARRVLQTGQPIVVEPAPAVAGAIVGVPVVSQERLIGVLTASRSDPSEPFRRHDLELLELFAAQAAIAIEHARLFEEATTAEALRELGRLKAEFLNTISHELRTPLSLIHGYAELLIHRADRLSPADVAQMSHEIYAGSQTLIRLVDDLLDFSRLDRERLTLCVQPVRLDRLLDRVVLGCRAQPGGGRVSAECPPDLRVAADPERLEQILGRLLDNALAYAVEGRIAVRASRAGEAVRVEIADHGPGLLPEEIDRVWETFYRGTEAAELPNRGSGLGLAVVKQLVELHGGRVGVASVPGQGATFWFTLPVAVPGSTDGPEAEPAPAPHRRGGSEVDTDGDRLTAPSG